MNPMPSVLVLLAALLLPAAAAEPDAPAQVKAEVLVASTQSWDGQELPPFPEGQPEITVMRIVIPPHSKLPVHKHPVYNAGVLTKGTLTVQIVGGPDDGKEKTLSAGDGMIEVTGTWHYGRNDGDEPAEIIVVYVGPKGTPVTVKKDGDGGY